MERDHGKCTVVGIGSMSNLFEALPDCKAEFSVVEIEDFVTRGDYEGWCHGVEATVKCLNNAEPTVVCMEGDSDFGYDVLPTDCLDGLGIDPFIATSYMGSNPNWCSVLAFSHPFYWFGSNNVQALLNAVCNEIERQAENLPATMTLTVKSLRCSGSNASFQVSVTYEGIELTLPYFIENLSTYRTRMKATHLNECFSRLPRTWEETTELYCRHLLDHRTLHNVLETISSEV